MQAGVGLHTGPAEGHLPDENSNGEHCADALRENCPPVFIIRDWSGQTVVQRVADSNEAVRDHGHQGPGLYGGDADEVHLDSTCLETDRGELRPENGQHGRQGGERQAQVCHDQHGEEIVRGCMEAVVSLYHPE